MRKLVYVFAAIVALTFAACGNNTAKVSTGDSAVVDSTTDTVVIDSIVIDSVD